jgi:hypothetical protein
MAGFFGQDVVGAWVIGYWAFEGDWQPAQTASRAITAPRTGGGIIDMLCHWRYVLDNLFGRAYRRAVQSVRLTFPSASTNKVTLMRPPPMTPPMPPLRSPDGVIARDRIRRGVPGNRAAMNWSYSMSMAPRGAP